MKKNKTTHTLWGEEIFIDAGENENFFQLLITALGNSILYMLYFIPVTYRKWDIANKYITRTIAVILSVTLIPIFWDYSIILAIFHLIFMLLFHMEGGFLIYPEKSFEKNWGIDNNLKRFIYYSFPLTMILSKIYNKIEEFFLLILLVLVMYFDKEE